MSTKYTKEVLQDAVDNSLSLAGVLRYLGLKQAGGTQTHIGSKIKAFNINTEHFTGQNWNKGRTNLAKVPKENVLVIRPAGSPRVKTVQLRRCMLESGLKHQCICGITNEWNGKPLTLEINHINGDWLDNRIENLEFLCPNCHSQEVHSNMPHKYR